MLRDIDLLRCIAQRSTLAVNLSVTTVRTRLARLLEPRAPRPDLRLDAVRALREAGISAGILAMPIVPGITDRVEDLDALARAASDARAQWFAGNVLFLMPASLRHFLPFLDAKFPKLSRQYRGWYGRHGNAPDGYRKEITARVESLRRKYGLGSRPDRSANRSWKSPQLQLGLGINQGGEACPA